jgi:membrane associated rhomboid family serine protease
MELPMYRCPACRKPLFRKQSEQGLYWDCGGCSYRLVGLSILKKTVAAPYLNNLWLEARALAQPQGAPCPACSAPMAQVFRGAGSNPLSFQFCLLCEVAWLGPMERAALPPPSPAQDPNDLSKLPPEAAKIIAITEVQRMAEEARKQDQGLEELAPWQKALMFIGLPMTSDDHEPWLRFPWATVGTVFFTFMVSLYFFSRIDETALRWGFIPAQWSRDICLTSLTSFFLHGNWVHLLSNMYFLLLFGFGVEKKVGPFHFLAILFLSTVVGDALTYAWDPTDSRPGIGASGGIAGIMVFFALAYPRSNLYFYSIYGQGSISAFWFMFIWVISEAIYGTIQVKGWEDEIGHFAHLGGALFGFVYWLLIWIIFGKNVPKETGPENL